MTVEYDVMHSTRLDANESAFFLRNLETIKAKTYDIIYPELKALEWIPVSAEAGPGAETITYQSFDMLGMAKVIANYSDDLPRADIKGQEFHVSVRSLGASYGYNVQEIRAANFAGRNLEQRKANAARFSIEQKLNKIGWTGDTDSGLQGLVNNPNVTRIASPNNGSGSSTLWSSKTAANILADLNTIADTIFTSTNGVEQPNTMLMPLSQYTLIATTRVDSVTPLTIMQFFLMNSPFIKHIEPIWEMQGAGIGIQSPSIAAGGDCVIAYDYNPDKLTFEVPIAFEQFAAQEEGLEFLIPCHARTAGVIVYYPLSIAIMEGV